MGSVNVRLEYTRDTALRQCEYQFPMQQKDCVTPWDIRWFEAHELNGVAIHRMEGFDKQGWQCQRE